MELSILIPARNEMLLARTIQDILEHREADTEVIAVLDGQWANPGIPQHERVNVIYVPEAVGQRAAQNLAARLAKGKYVMKVDAHCSFDQGFDRKMIEAFKETGDDVTMVPVMRNLWAYDWKCYICGKKWYQANKPDECDVCKTGKKLRLKMVWEGKRNPQSTSYSFGFRDDKDRENDEPHFMYFEDYKHRPQYRKDKEEKGLTETMSLQGSCFMATRENYWKLKLCDEDFGNWGNQGIEVACKTWLSGGRCLVNHKTWYAHMFRTNSKLHFPWPTSGNDQQRVKKNVKEAIWNMKCPYQKYPVSWLVKKFWPVPGWLESDVEKLKKNRK